MNFGHSFSPYECTFHISRFDEFHFKSLPYKICVSIFYNILIYNKSWEEHVQHVDRVLQLGATTICKTFQMFLWGKGGRVFGSYCIS